MPADIRSFFGGAPGAPPSSQEKSPKKVPAKSRGKRKVVEDSDDDDVAPAPKKTTPKKPPPKKREPTPEEETTASGFFGEAKPKRSAPLKTAPERPTANGTPKKATPKSKKSAPAKTPPSRASGRRTQKVDYNEDDFDNDKILDDDLEDSKNDISAADFKTNGKIKGDDHVEVNDSELEVAPQPKRATSTRAKQNSKAKKPKMEEDDYEDIDMDDVADDDDFIVPDDEEDTTSRRSKRKDPPNKAATSTKKRKSEDLEDDLDIPAKSSKAAKTSTPKKPATPKKGKEVKQDSTEIKSILERVPLVRPPSPPAPSQDGEKPKFKFGQAHANSGPAPASGAKEPPTGNSNCLAGLSFVFTGLLQYLDRNDAQALVKRYGGQVMGAPSGKTSYVVLGSDAGPKKLETIRKNGIKTIDEDGLFFLIENLPANGGDSAAGEKAAEKRKAEEDKAKAAAAEMDKQEKQAQKEKAKAASSAPATGAPPKKKVTDDSSQALWTTKYAPSQMAHIVGNKAPVEKLQKWLREFSKNKKKGFRLAGADGFGIYRAVMISGPPGIGKTTAAHLVAKLESYDILETNASDTRSKKLVENGLKGVLDTTSLFGYFAGDQQKVDKAKKKIVLIMDEVDGMSAGDRGGVGALAAICRKTEVPMILICNERSLPKMKPFDHVTYELKFRRPTTDQIRSRLMTIGFREGIKLSKEVLDALIEGTGADIRQVINMLSTAKMDMEASEMSLDFDGSKKMSKSWEKHVVLKPWDIVGKILGGGMFGPASKATINDKSELYFNDHEMSFLMLQENYLGTNPNRSNQLRGKEQDLKKLDLVEQAANSISEGDLIDRMIHGPEQHWSLMPTHAIFSFVRPASFIYGNMSGGAYMGDNNRTRFSQWLGKNSNQQKLSRMIKEIQAHMRLRSSGDRHQIRQEYLPVLWTNLVKKLAEQGKDTVPEAIDLMDSYFLTKEDFDAIVELGVGPMSEDNKENKLETQTKATFTRLYNQQTHPVPFMKASNVQAPKKLGKEKPDLEEAFDESDEAEVIDDAPGADDEEDNDLSKDKYVKQPKKKKGAAAAKGKKAAAGEDGEEDEEGSPSAKKGKGKGKGKAKK